LADGIGRGRGPVGGGLGATDVPGVIGGLTDEGKGPTF
jgi:hypothetical protein